MKRRFIVEITLTFEKQIMNYVILNYKHAARKTGR